MANTDIINYCQLCVEEVPLMKDGTHYGVAANGAHVNFVPCLAITGDKEEDSWHAPEESGNGSNNSGESERSKVTPDLRVSPGQIESDARAILRELSELRLANNRDELLALQVRAQELLKQPVLTGINAVAAARQIADIYVPNYSDKPINYEGEAVRRITGIITRYVRADLVAKEEHETSTDR